MLILDSTIELPTTDRLYEKARRSPSEALNSNTRLPNAATVKASFDTTNNENHRHHCLSPPLSTISFLADKLKLLDIRRCLGTAYSREIGGTWQQQRQVCRGWTIWERIRMSFARSCSRSNNHHHHNNASPPHPILRGGYNNDNTNNWNNTCAITISLDSPPSLAPLFDAKDTPVHGGKRNRTDNNAKGSRMAIIIGLVAGILWF